jgi:hypothetical protein
MSQLQAFTNVAGPITVGFKGELARLADPNITDKDTAHSYCPVYEQELGRLRLTTGHVLEIGVQRGGSACMWLQYFDYATVHGVDISPKPQLMLLHDPRYQHHQKDAYSADFVASLPDLMVAIDDGPHTVESQLSFIRLYGPKIEPAGLLIIEDIAADDALQRITAQFDDRWVVRVYDRRALTNRFDDVILVAQKTQGMVVMVDDRGYADFIQGAAARNKAFADMHGHAFRFYRPETIVSPAGQKRHPSWTKIIAVAHALQSVDWVLYIDSDAAVVAPRQPVPMREKSWFIADRPWNRQSPNAGIFLLHKRDLAWLPQWWEFDLPEHDNKHSWEQAALQRLWDTLPLALYNAPHVEIADEQWVRHCYNEQSNRRKDFCVGAPVVALPEPIPFSCTQHDVTIGGTTSPFYALWKQPRAMKIAVYSLAKNEEKHAAAWAESCKEADYRVVTDTGSADKTPDILRAAGVSVYTGNVVPWRWDEAHNLSMHHIPSDADVCVRLDLDERFKPGWRAAIEQAWKPGTTKLRYMYTWSMTPDGKPLKRFPSDRVHSRSGYRWTGATHEGLVRWNGAEVFAWSDELEILHHRDFGKKHSTDMELLQIAVRETPHDARMYWYLARQMDYENHTDTVATFLKYLDMPGGSSIERAYACRVLSRRLPDKAEYWLQRAIQEDAAGPDGYYAMAKLAHQNKNHLTAFYYGKQAADRAGASMMHTSDTEAFSHLPADITSVNAFLLGLNKEALRYTKIALERSPNDERLKRNLEQLSEQLKAH